MPMTSLSPSGYITDLTSPPPGGGGVGGGTAWLEQLRNFVAQLMGGSAGASVTLSSDSFTPSVARNVLDTEGAAATDNLSAIGITNVPDGTRIEISGANAARVITVVHSGSGTGHVELCDGSNLVLDDTSITLTLEKIGSAWYERARSFGNAKSKFRTFWGLAIGSNIQAFNANLAALAGLTGSSGKIARFTGAGTMDLIDTTDLGMTLSVIAKTGNASMAAGDKGKEINFTTAGFTYDLLAPATAGNGFPVTVRNSASSGDVTLISYAVDGLSNRKLRPGDCVLLRSDGSAWKTVAGCYSFESGENTPTPSSQIVIAHGGVRRPDLVELWARCKTIDDGYAVGEEVLCGTSGYLSTTKIQADATNVNIAIPATGMNQPTKTGGAIGAVTAASWAYFVRCYWLR